MKCLSSKVEIKLPKKCEISFLPCFLGYLFHNFISNFIIRFMYKDEVAMFFGLCYDFLHNFIVRVTTSSFQIKKTQIPKSLLKRGFVAQSFLNEMTTSVTKNSHQGRSPCYLLLLFFPYPFTLLFCCETKSWCGCCFSQQIVQLVYKVVLIILLRVQQSVWWLFEFYNA